MKIINLTQHQATAEQISAGVVDMTGTSLDELRKALTFVSLPDAHDIVGRANSIAVMTKLSGFDAAMIGGAPFLMSPLERKLKSFGIKVLYAFSERVSSEEVQSDGTVKKINVFKHVGFVQS